MATFNTQLGDVKTGALSLIAGSFGHDLTPSADAVSLDSVETAMTPYRWHLTASLPNGGIVTVFAVGSYFGFEDADGNEIFYD